MHTYTHADSILDGRIASLISMLRILMEIRSPTHAKREKSLNDFIFGPFTGRFSNDGAASIAVKGLTCRWGGAEVEEKNIGGLSTLRMTDRCFLL